MKVSEVLQVARYLIHVPEWWFGNDAFKRNARQTCAMLATEECRQKYGATFEQVNAANKYLGTAAGFTSRKDSDVFWELTGYNDTHSHADVLDKFDKAIAIAQAEEA